MSNDILLIDNYPSSNILDRTMLTADALAAQKNITLANPVNFGTNVFAVVGNPGAENAQISYGDSLAAFVLTLHDNLSAKHFTGEVVTALKANQAKIYRAANVDGTTPADADFSVVATIDLQADKLATEYVATNGGSGYWYKYTFYNSISTSESPIADAVAVRGGNYGHYVTVDQVRREAGFQTNRWITDQLIYEKITMAESEVNASLVIANYTLPLSEPYPGLIVNATMLLAAGYLLQTDQGVMHSGTTKEGNLKIKAARDILTKLENSTTQLTDPTTGSPVDQSTTVRGYPDEAANSDEREAAFFTRQQRF